MIENRLTTDLMDPLALLREYCMTNKLERVVQNGTRIDFDELYR